MGRGRDWDRARRRDTIRDRGADPISSGNFKATQGHNSRGPRQPTQAQLDYIKTLRQKLRSEDRDQPQYREEATRMIEELKFKLTGRRQPRR